MKVMKIVNQNLNDNDKNLRSCARELFIDCGLCQYGVHKYSGYGVLSNTFAVLETIWVWHFGFLTR